MAVYETISIIWSVCIRRKQIGKNDEIIVSNSILKINSKNHLLDRETKNDAQLRKKENS